MIYGIIVPMTESTEQFAIVPGVGVTVVNFLSEWCEVDVSRDGFIYHQEYERGIVFTNKYGTMTMLFSPHGVQA